MIRRDFIKTSAAATLGMAMGPAVSFAGNMAMKETNRPKMPERNFTSKAVEKTIKEIKKNIKDKELAWLFENCFPNTLDTTVEYSEKNGKPDTFVITGDIHAMWLRDSSAQVWPYVALVKKDKKLKNLIQGVISRHNECIIIDPYANAFNKGPEGGEWQSDHTDMKPELHERKWEIDSLCYAVRLANGYWKETDDTSIFDDRWEKAMKLVVKTFKEQQRKEGKGPYHFARTTSRATDTLSGDGYGNPVKPVGLICSAFRPSDDATIYPFLIPSNLFAVQSLRQLADIYNEVKSDTASAKECEDLANEVEAAIQKYAVAEHLDHGKIYAFEVDGYGNKLFMDDSNVPSLLSMGYLGCLDINDPIYQNTRNFVLSEDNPYFFSGKAAKGIGGPHVGMDYIWHMSITLQAMTATNDDEIKQCLEWLKTTHAGTGFMHEGFHKDDPDNFTRSWFAWSNTLFGELIYILYKEKPHLLT